MATRCSSRVLVTTALESSWPDVGTPVLFLGEWCRLHERRAHWSRYDGELVSYHWDDRQRLQGDFDYLQSLNESLLFQLVGQLNEIHAVERSMDYWRLLVGYWLNLFTAVLFDRWENLREAIGTGTVSHSVTLDYPADSIVARDTSHFLHLICDDAWNHAIFSRLLRDWTTVPLRATEGTCEPEAKLMPGRVLTARNIVIRSLSTISSYWSKPSDRLLYASGLPLADELRLQLRLGQRPSLRVSRPCPEAKVDPLMRAWVLTPDDPEDIFERIACSLVAKLLPTAFVEGYGSLVDAARSLGWPEQPTLVWTSYAHFTDEVFKTWVADKRETGTILVIGHHGAMAQGLISGVREYQRQVSDHELVWGPEGEVGKESTVVGIWKGLPARRGRRSGVTLVAQAVPRYSFDLRSMPIAGQMVSYLEDQFSFARALPAAIRDELTVRLYPHDYGWSQQLRWKDRFPDIRLDDGKQPISNLIKGTRLLVSTYNFTTYYESISANIPTVMYWNPDHWEITPMARSYLGDFADMRIYHDTPESAAQHVSEIWDDVESWWMSASVQDVVSRFKEQYCQVHSNQLARLASAIRAIGVSIE
jgi:putative transferase (TIGR04331 family)